MGLGEFLGGLFGGAVSSAGGIYAARTNLKIAKQNRRFQEKMSSTAYQRSMKDMRKAGLNPILAYKQGGASSPGGSALAVQNPLSGTAEGVKAGVTTALNVKTTREQLKKLRAETANVQLQGRILAGDVPGADLKGDVGRHLLEELRRAGKSHGPPKGWLEQSIQMPWTRNPAGNIKMRKWPEKLKSYQGNKK